MNRSAYCIQMLTLLSARGFMSKEELANELGVNLRNISEYRKELESAGYSILTVSGKYGGYTLERGALLPVVGFTTKENKALHHAMTYLKGHPDFLLFEDYQKAIDKVFTSSTSKLEENGVYLRDEHPLVHPEMIVMMDMVETARKTQKVVSMQYKSMHAKEFTTILIHPYEIINYKGSYYCMAYSLKAKDYRNFKFSKERMRQVKILDAGFTRDSNFHVKDHVGSIGLIQDEVYELELIIEQEQAVLMAERAIGCNPKMEWIEDGKLHYTTMMEGKMETISFLLSLGAQCKIIQPNQLQKEIYEILQAMLGNYSFSKDLLV